MLTRSSMLATFWRMTCGGKVRSPWSRRALAAARRGHGPFSFWSRMCRSIFYIETKMEYGVEHREKVQVALLLNETHFASDIRRQSSEFSMQFLLCHCYDATYFVDNWFQSVCHILSKCVYSLQVKLL